MDQGVIASEGLPEPLTNPFGLIHLVLPENLAVSTHVLRGSGKNSKYILKREFAFFLESRETDEKMPVRWTSPLKSYEKRTSSGILVGDILTVHGGFISIHPKGPCRFGRSGLSCRYCGDTKELGKHPPFTKRDLIEALRIVLQEKSCDIVNLSSGHVETEDGGVEWLSPWVTEIRRHVNIMISLDLVPPKTNEWIDKTYAIGVDALYYDLDFFNPHDEPASQAVRDHQRQLEALEYAAKIFSRGAVLSHVVIGFEPPEETIRNIDLLVDRGVVPILVYFPPNDGAELKKRWTVTPEKIQRLYAHLFERLVEKKITPHWVQQGDVVLTPMEGRFFSEKKAGYHLPLIQFYQTGLGRTVRSGLASIRRHLRVREVPVP